MYTTIKAQIEFKITGEALEDAFADFDEITVSELLREVIDKAIACDAIEAKVIEGPNTLEEYDSNTQSE